MNVPNLSFKCVKYLLKMGPMVFISPEIQDPPVQSSNDLTTFFTFFNQKFLVLFPDLSNAKHLDETFRKPHQELSRPNAC